MTSHFLWASRTTPLQTGAGTAFGVNGDHEQGLCLFTRFCSAKFSTCIAVRLLKFSVLHGKGESKYRPVATNFQCLKMFCHMVCHLLGSAFPKPCSSVALVSAQKRRVALHSPLHPGVGIYHFHRRSNMTEMKSPNVHARENRNDTPRKRKTHIIKVRVTAEEKLRIA